ncbi:MAG TPA: glycosyl transferase family 1 [Burkholderiales bacterium]|nr:glycosyl transferase family 1 [Burkholderiales bacterium]
MKIAYLVWDLSDAATVRRAEMLQAGGAHLVAAGFRRGETAPTRLAGAPALDLGRTFDGRLAHRAGLVALRCARLAALRDVVQGADVVLARNLETLAIAALARRAYAPRAKLVYECLDIHRLMCGAGPASIGLRALESALLRSCSAVIVSAPAFISEYFEKRHRHLPRMVLVENKVLRAAGPIDRRQAAPRPAGPPWRIGWFGNLRCRKSVDLLKDIVRRAGGAVEVVMRGRPSAHTLPDLETLIADTPHIRFAGPYAQADLARIYGEVHFAWSLDYTDEGMNSDWLLPNRIYEGSFFNTPSIAERRTAIGGWLADKGAGLLVDDPVADTVRMLSALTPDAYRVLEQRTGNIDTRAIAFDREACVDLVASLAYGRSLSFSELPAVPG